jgi:hypothetical protein
MALDPTMNCFEWQNHASDFLDETLPESLKKKAEQHIKSCTECSEKHQNYKTIVGAISSLPLSALPPPLRKAPLSAHLPRSETARIALSHWEQIPWYLRTLLEAGGIIFFVLLGISSAPLIRSFYEKSIEKTLSEFRGSFTGAEPTLAENDPSLPPVSVATGSTHSGSSEEELNGEDDSENESENVKVGKSELWRFTLKTVSPDEIRPVIVKTLTDLKIPTSTPGLGGVQVPGGIEFDLILPQSDVPNIKKALEKISPRLSGPTHGSATATAVSTHAKKDSSDETEESASENFSWYKVKSKRKVPEGKSQVVIWLSQPN